MIGLLMFWAEPILEVYEDPRTRPEYKWLQHHLRWITELYPKSNPQSSAATAMATMTSSTTTSSPSLFSYFASFFPSNSKPATAKSSFVSAQPQRDRDSASPSSMMSRSEIESLSTEASAAMCPALANANVMFFRSAYNVQVIVDENEHEEKLLGRFRREVMRAGIIQECKRRKFFENRQEEKKRRTRDAAKRNRKRRPFRPAVAEGADATKAKKDSDDGDNWDLPEGL